MPLCKAATAGTAYKLRISGVKHRCSWQGMAGRQMASIAGNQCCQHLLSRNKEGRDHEKGEEEPDQVQVLETHSQTEARALGLPHVASTCGRYMQFALLCPLVL